MMQHLPLELTTKIATECTIPCLKALRLTDKRLDGIATPLLFEDVWIGLHSLSAMHLRQLSASDRVRFVKQLTFVGDLIPDLVGFEVWKNRVQSHTLSKQQLKHRYNGYAKYFYEQYRMRHKSQYRNMLKELISKLSSLQSIIVLSRRWAPDYDDDRLRCFWNAVEEKTSMVPGTLVTDFEAEQ